MVIFAFAVSIINVQCTMNYYYQYYQWYYYKDYQHRLNMTVTVTEPHRWNSKDKIIKFPEWSQLPELNSNCATSFSKSLGSFYSFLFIVCTKSYIASHPFTSELVSYKMLNQTQYMVRYGGIRSSRLLPLSFSPQSRVAHFAQVWKSQPHRGDWTLKVTQSSAHTNVRHIWHYLVRFALSAKNFYRTQVSLGSDLWVRFSLTEYKTFCKLN